MNEAIQPLEELEVLRKEHKALLNFLKRFESCDYRPHNDFVKARELEMWQERAEELLFEIEEGLL